jgi:hypothetical protein
MTATFQTIRLFDQEDAICARRAALCARFAEG